MEKTSLFLKNNYSKIIIIIFLSLIIDISFILKINIPPAWDQGYHLSNVFKMYNILGDQGINVSEKLSQLLDVTDSYRGPLTYFLSALFLKFLIILMNLLIYRTDFQYYLYYFYILSW